MLIRPAQNSDIPLVLPMVAQICAFHQQLDGAKYGFLPNPERRYESWLTNQINEPSSVFLVVEAGEVAADQPKLMAFLIATTEQEIPIYRVRQYGFIHDLWVEPEYRQMGIARLLVRRAIAQFTQLGVPQIRLDVVSGNPVARQLFESCGFRVSTMELLLEL